MESSSPFSAGKEGRDSGILLLDKPGGMTSNAALQRAKRVLGIGKAGHTGALDPMATGLLPLCFGQATKVSAFLLDADKRYRAEITLGAETDSGDADGTVTDSSPVGQYTPEQIESVLERFRGPIEQVPPMYSALKHRGKRLHELARAGIEIERRARAVVIHSLRLLGRTPERLSLSVHCSKGTYIRSLAADIGRALGCGAHLTALRREGSGPFSLTDAVSLMALEPLPRCDARALLLPPDAAVPDWPRVDVGSQAAADIRHGRAVSTELDSHENVRIYADTRFLGLGRIDAAGMLRVRRLFV
jgi:tRNA pseudouridine55 synthase